MDYLLICDVAWLGLDQALLRLAWDDVLAIVFATALLYRCLSSRLFVKDPYHHLWFERPQGSVDASKSQVERDIAKALRTSAKEIIIFFGSQSGTSERLAQRLGQHLDKRLALPNIVADLSDYDPSTAANLRKDQIALFVLSTYGEGDPPDNATAFSEWINSSLSQNCLQDVQFAIFGMGNSKYTFYNQFAKTVNTLLLSFGASPLIDITLADAANDLIDEDFYSWTEKISQTLANKLGAECKQQEYQPALTIQFGENTLDKDTNQIAVPHHALIYNTQKSKYAIYELPIKATRLLACANGKYYLHAEIDLSQNLRLKYNTGDHIDIWSENSDAAIKALQKALGISSAVMTAAFICVPRNPEVATHQKLNGQYTLDALFRRYLDIAAPVSREFILDLVQFAESPSAKRGLAIIGKSKEAYTQLRASQNICLARILNMFGPYSVWNIPIPFILERMQFISPRTYSISSASTVSPRQVSITVSTKQIELKNDKEVIHGLASHYLLDIHRAMSTCRPTIVCQVRKSTFKPPFSLLQPMIMIAAGTGIAPFRAFIQQRVRQAELGKEVGSMVLFFGCRSQDDDLYADEHAHAKQVLKERFTLVVAHSSPASGKVYVQDRLQQHDQNFGSLILDEDASLYVCGSTSLATGVRVTVRRIICERQGWSEAEYLEFESRQKRSKRWQEDLFG